MNITQILLPRSEKKQTELLPIGLLCTISNSTHFSSEKITHTQSAVNEKQLGYLLNILKDVKG